MFDLIQPEYQREGGATYYQHHDVSNTQLFQDMGSVRRVPIEAITSQDYSDVELWNQHQCRIIQPSKI